MQNTNIKAFLGSQQVKDCLIRQLIDSPTNPQRKSKFPDYLAPEKTGIPSELLLLINEISVSMMTASTNDKCDPNKFLIQALSAIPIGSDLSKVWSKFAVWLLVDPDNGIIRFQEIKAIQNVANLYQRVVNGEQVKAKEWADVLDELRVLRGIAESGQSHCLDMARDEAVSGKIFGGWRGRDKVQISRARQWEVASAAISTARCVALSSSAGASRQAAHAARLTWVNTSWERGFLCEGAIKEQAEKLISLLEEAR